MLVFPINSNAKLCRIFDQTGKSIYVLVNFFAYRVLITKASVFDSMQQHECMQRATWWLTHVLSCLFLHNKYKAKMPAFSETPPSCS
mmetsp:Transcript_7900/g.15531  ORF Transcript_7900/g.15531 Transcript_7900/m.15531 type:complete len:87 (+) Transcript_7900:344-604(+)